MKRIAVAQMTSSNNLERNFGICADLIKKAAAKDVTLLSLPECFSFIGEKAGESLAIAQPLDGHIMDGYRQLARENQMWLALGGFQETGPDSLHLYNSHVLLDDTGNIREVYRKIHLFDVNVPGGPILMESNTTAAGSEVVVADSPAGRLGLTVCYDLRFPELYQRLRFCKGAEIFLVPSAFTKRTGEAHWEVLLRARAIECQCYVMASAQAGVHSTKRESYGHAMIVNPWGEVVAKLDDPLETGIAVAEVNEELLESTRVRMPILEHRRMDIYGGGSSKS